MARDEPVPGVHRRAEVGGDWGDRGIAEVPIVLPPRHPRAALHTPDYTSNGVLTVGLYHLQHPCAVPDCEREAKAADYCAAHLVRIARHGEPGPATFGAYIRGGLCSVPGCERRRYALALCSAHYMAARRRGAR
jgi:hypothetical protein